MQKVRNERSFGQNLRALRIAAGLTQDQVAIQLQLRGYDISRSAYSQFECGLYNIRVGELIALKEIFHVSFEDFFAPLENEQKDLSDPS